MHHGSKSNRIRALLDEGRAVNDIARDLGLHYSFVYGVARRHMGMSEVARTPRRRLRSSEHSPQYTPSTIALPGLIEACRMYGRLTNYDESYQRFLTVTHGSPDLTLPEHCQALLDWLNRWGCRQFSLAHHNVASQHIRSWYDQGGAQLPTNPLWELTDSELKSASAAYAALVQQIAGHRKRDGYTYAVTVGPTGASKILFAIRPQSCVPWDDPIRRGLGYDGSQASYFAYHRAVRARLADLAVTCEQEGFPLTELPRRIGRPFSSVPKLIDEYYWVTLTRQWRQTP